MFQEQRALFFYCVSPVHMGADTAIGLIDNPIQRERHTEYPLFAGSGLKGAVRHHFRATGWLPDLLDRIFGPERNAAEFAGALSFGDAQLVAFPVRCTRCAYVYATSPTALGRTRRQLHHLGIDVPWTVPTVDAGSCRITSGSSVAVDRAGEDSVLHLEVFEHRAEPEQELSTIASWFAQNALPPGDEYDFFRDKLTSDLVLLPDEDFSHYVKNATEVEPHVRIDDATGAADGGGLFYTENLPPESLLLAPLLVSRERSSAGRRGTAPAMSASDVVDMVLSGNGNHPGLNHLLLQVGGDATTGRGQVVVKSVASGAKDDGNS